MGVDKDLKPNSSQNYHTTSEYVVTDESNLASDSKTYQKNEESVLPKGADTAEETNGELRKVAVGDCKDEKS